MRHLVLSAVLIAGLCPALQASADNVVANQVKIPSLSLEAQVFTEVDQDTVTITLQATKQDNDQAVITKALAETVNSVLSQLKTQDLVKVSTGNYSVRPRYNKDGEVTGWYGQSQIYLESTNIKAASELAAKYQEVMPVSHVAFSVSKAARAKVEEQLMQEVASAFSARATAMAHSLGYQNFQIKDINLGGSGAVYRTNSYKHDMMAASPAVAAEALPIDAGTDTVTLSLQGSVYLLDKK